MTHDLHRHEQDDELYRELILEHNRAPHNFGALEGAALRRRDMNTSCGDDVEIFAMVDDDGRITKASFVGQGCAISKASASMLTDALVGKTLAEVATLGAKDIFDLVGADLTGSRLTCALLPLLTLQKAITDRATEDV